jgi:phosphopantetheinyl transferase (holo-ACP synthase)
MERIETRGWEFVDDFFTPDEIAQVRETSLAERDTLVTAIWSAKEAVLKALHVGLTVDTRCVSVTLDTRLLPLDNAPPPFEMSSNGGGICHPAGAMDFTVENWRRFDVVLASPLDPGLQDHLTGWWGLYGTYVLTLVLKEG